MPFKPNDPKTIAAAKRGGATGKKHFETMPKDRLRKLTAKAGRLSGKSRQAAKAKQLKANRKAAEKIEERIMSNYLP